MISHGRLAALIAAASLGAGLARPISEDYEYDDDHAPYPTRDRHPDAPTQEIMPQRARPELEYFESKRPLTKRQKRRLRGKAKE